MSMQGVIALLISISGLWFAGYVLLSKTSFEEVFMTTEQKMKQRLFAVLVAVLYFTILFPLLYVTWECLEITSINWSMVSSIALNTFVISLVILGRVIKTIANFITKEKIMYKVTIDGLDEMYLIKMLDREICICSPNASVDLNDLSEETFLIKMNDLMKLPILKENFPLPPLSTYQKFLK